MLRRHQTQDWQHIFLHPIELPYSRISSFFYFWKIKPRGIKIQNAKHLELFDLSSAHWFIFNNLSQNRPLSNAEIFWCISNQIKLVMWCTSDSIWLKIWHYDMSQKWQVKKLSKLRKNFKFSGKKFRNFLPIRSIFLLQANWKLHGLKNWNKSMEIRMQRVHMLLWNSKICENLRKITKNWPKKYFWWNCEISNPWRKMNIPI